MERKNYLVEELSEDEDKYIICSINKAFLSAIRKYAKEKRVKKYSIDDTNIQEQLPIKEDIYFETDLNEFDYWGISCAYTKEQQDICVQKLEKLAVQFGLEKYIRTLTDSEKLVFFLLEVRCLSVKDVSICIKISRQAVWQKRKSAERKIKEAKLKYGRR